MRPRVRRRVGDDGTEEITLESYRAAQDASEAQRLLLEALVGRSTRRVGQVVHNQRGSSKSSVSRMWQKVGREKFAQLRRRPLDVDSEGKRRDWLALMLDGFLWPVTAIATGSCRAELDSGNRRWELGLAMPS